MDFGALREEALLPRRIQFISTKKLPADSQNNESQSLYLDWKGVLKPGTGLRNVGNTCFLNSTLQCLLYTPPVVYSPHTCKGSQFCALCSLRKISITQLSSIVPQDFIQCLRLIGKQFRLGRQEDSHEFLRCLMEKLPKDFVDSTFKGQLRSVVKCQTCAYESETFDDFLDLSLELSAQDLTRCLANFCREEVLDGSNKYYCIRCQRKVIATKQFSIKRNPAVLTVHLKRFTNQLRKDTRPVSYSQDLDLAPFSLQQGHSKYKLYAVLVHQGATVHSGHYYAFVQAGNQLWYEMNDSNVSPANMQRALSHGAAYILFYKLAIKKQTNGIVTKPKPTPEVVFLPVQTTPPRLEDLSSIPLKRLGPSLWKAESRLSVLKQFRGADKPIQVMKQMNSALAIGYVKDEYDQELDRGKVKKIKVHKRLIPRSLWDNATVHS